MLSFTRFSATAGTALYDTNVFSYTGAPWTLQVFAGGAWRNCDAPTNPTSFTLRFTFGGAVISVGDPWRVLTDNGAITWQPNNPFLPPCSGLTL